MTRSERLAKEGKMIVDIGEFATAKVITAEQMSANARKLRYIGTDYAALFDGREVSANIYENNDGDIFAVIE